MLNLLVAEDFKIMLAAEASRFNSLPVSGASKPRENASVTKSRSAHFLVIRTIRRPALPRPRRPAGGKRDWEARLRVRSARPRGAGTAPSSSPDHAARAASLPTYLTASRIDLTVRFRPRHWRDAVERWDARCVSSTISLVEIRP